MFIVQGVTKKKEELKPVQVGLSATKTSKVMSRLRHNKSTGITANMVTEINFISFPS